MANPQQQRTPDGDAEGIQSSFGEPVLNKIERMSVDALVNYTAYYNGVSEKVVCSHVGNHFGTDSLGQLRSSDYDKVIRYLVNLNLQEL